MVCTTLVHMPIVQEQQEETSVTEKQEYHYTPTSVFDGLESEMRN